jgi:hypothetical protein
MFFTKLRFWLESIERAIKTAAQFMIFYLIGSNTGESNPINFFSQDFSWGNLFGFAASGMILSILTSLASGGFTPQRDSPSLVRTGPPAS